MRVPAPNAAPGRLPAIAAFVVSLAVAAAICAYSLSLASHRDPAIGLVFASVALPLPLLALMHHHRDVVDAFATR
jgi:hypothetical protein